MKMMMFAAFVLSFVSTLPASAASYANWDSNGNCYEWTPGGAIVQSLPYDRCRHSVGSYFNWDTNGNCYEWTPRKAIVQSASYDRCRWEAGSVYDWDSSGNCYEWTLSRRAIVQSASYNYCRQGVYNPPHHGPQFPGSPSQPNSNKPVGLYAYNAANDAISLIKTLHDQVEAADYEKFLLPIKQIAALVKAKAQHYSSDSNQVQPQLKELLASLRNANGYLGQLLTVENLFEPSQKLLAVQSAVSKLIKQ